MKKYSIDDLRNIMVQLRGENGCPWDKVQTHQSIKKSMIEECYEAIDALDSGDDHAFANELGDVLLQVVFHARIAEERGAFDFDDVVNEICTKLIHVILTFSARIMRYRQKKHLDSGRRTRRKRKILIHIRQCLRTYRTIFRHL